MKGEEVRRGGRREAEEDQGEGGTLWCSCCACCCSWISLGGERGGDRGRNQTIIWQIRLSSSAKVNRPNNVDTLIYPYIYICSDVDTLIYPYIYAVM